MAKRAFSVGDLVEHRLLGSEKVIIGIQKDRYLCAHSEDIEEGGYLRRGSRVAVHSEEHLVKKGRYGNVTIIVHPEALGEKEHRGTRRRRRKKFFTEKRMKRFAAAAAVPAVIAVILFPSMDAIRSRLKDAFSSETEEAEEGELTEGGVAGVTGAETVKSRAVKEKLKKRFLKPSIKESDIRKVQAQYLKANISPTEAKRLMDKYMSGNLSASEKKRLKAKYLKSGMTKADIERLKAKYLKSGAVPKSP